MKYTYDDVKKVFESKNYTLLTQEEDYKNCSQKLEYICNKHKDKGVMEISFSKLNYGQGCYYCGRERTITSRIVAFDKVYDANLCKEKGFSYVDTIRENGIIYIQFICNKHKEYGIQKMRKSNMKRNIKGCIFCKGDLPESVVREKISKISPHIKIIGEYKNMSTCIECYCEKHNMTFYPPPNRLLKGSGCYYCGTEKLSINSTMSQSDFEQRVKISNDNLTVISNYSGLMNDVRVKCNKCGYEWVLNAYSLVKNGTSCRKCSFSYKGEDKIISILRDADIEYVHQYKFTDCIDKRPLPFDFYLPKYNLCIEFDGQQHFSPKFGDENYKNTIYHDSIKNDYCKKNNIHLLRIPYYKSDIIKELIFDEIERINIAS